MSRCLRDAAHRQHDEGLTQGSCFNRHFGRYDREADPCALLARSEPRQAYTAHGVGAPHCPTCSRCPGCKVPWTERRHFDCALYRADSRCRPSGLLGDTWSDSGWGVGLGRERMGGRAAECRSLRRTRLSGSSVCDRGARENACSCSVVRLTISSSSRYSVEFSRLYKRPASILCLAFSAFTVCCSRNGRVYRCRKEKNCYGPDAAMQYSGVTTQ